MPKLTASPAGAAQAFAGAVRMRYAALKARIAADPGRFCHDGLFWTFWLSLASFPIGYGVREALPPAAFLFLLGYYRFSWNESVLARLSVRWLFLCLFGMAVIGIVFSTNVWQSFLHVGREVNKAFILPFVAMECVRDEKDLRRLVWASVIACFWEGMDGIWQAFTGRDFILGYPLHNGRLTGSLADYCVGNYIALALIPAFGVWHILRRDLDRPTTAFLCAGLLWPAFFLLFGASARSGILAVAAVLILWPVMGARRITWKRFLWPAALVVLFCLFQPERFSPERVAGDGRWSLWSIGWRITQEYPWFGAGAGRYSDTLQSLALLPAKDPVTISHPHNVYLDLLYAHGVTGFTLGMIFLFGFLLWAFLHLRPRLLDEIESHGKTVYWRLTAWFWLGYAGWLINGITGHDFYRIWWLALAMSYLGVMTGAVANGLRAEEEDLKKSRQKPQAAPSLRGSDAP